MCIAGHIATNSRDVSLIQNLEDVGVVSTASRSGAKTVLLVKWSGPNTEVCELRLEIEETLGRWCC